VFVRVQAPELSLPTRAIRLRDAVRAVSKAWLAPSNCSFRRRAGKRGKRKERGGRPRCSCAAMARLGTAQREASRAATQPRGSVIFSSFVHASHTRLHTCTQFHAVLESFVAFTRQRQTRSRREKSSNWGVHRSRRRKRKKQHPAKRRLQKKVVGVTHVTDLN